MNFDVTIHTMRRLGLDLDLDLDCDGLVTEQGVRVLSREQAVAICQLRCMHRYLIRT